MVEGVSEETYLRYEIDRHPTLKNHHIKVYRIDGAYAHQFVTLLELLEIKTIIFTDLDLKRTKKEKKVDINDNDEDDIIPSNISDLKEKYENSTEYLTTNETLRYFIRKDLDDEGANYKSVNNHIFKVLTEKEELLIHNGKISLYSQGKINGYYATSFEEAIILTNAVDNRDENWYKKSLIKLLKYIHPKMRYFSDIDETSNIADTSYMYQVKLSDGKSKFSTGLVYLSVTDDDFNLKLPKYIESGLESLCDYFKE